MDAWRSKTVVITGASSGIGRATALSFAARGANVVLGSRGEESGKKVVAEIEAAGGVARFVPTDVRKAGDCERLVTDAVESFGRIDAAVNNAGFAGRSFAPVNELEEDEFDQVIDVNLKGVWLGMKYQIAQMLKQDPPGGAIVNTSSLNGLGGAPRSAAYSAGKAGVLALTKSAAQEVATQGIRINALAAGAYETPMLRGAMGTVAEMFGQPEEAIQQRYMAMIPMQRFGRPEEAAEAIIWLCSPAASYVTGHSMIADGGWSAPTR